MVTPMDDRSMVLLDDRDQSGKCLVILRAGLGRLVVLGPGRERFVYAMVGRNGPDSFVGGDGKARQLQELDGSVGHRRLLAVAFGDLFGSFRRLDLGSLLRHRPATRRIYSHIFGIGHWWVAHALRVARTLGRVGCPFFASVARVDVT